jgi:hypothetical protein
MQPHCKIIYCNRPIIGNTCEFYRSIGVQYKIIGSSQSQLLKGMVKNNIILNFNSMVIKPIEINPEWVLSELPQSLYADGNGNVSLYTENASDASWIKLALNTLCIPFEENEYGDDDVIFIDIEFNINDIKENCPTLYKSMKELDTKNKIYKNTSLN